MNPAPHKRVAAPEATPAAPLETFPSGSGKPGAPSSPVLDAPGPSSSPLPVSPPPAGSGEQDPGLSAVCAPVGGSDPIPAGGATRGRDALPAGTPRTWTIELPAGLKLLSLNGREHWAEKNRRAQALKKAAWAMAINAKLPRLERVSVVVEYQPPDRRHRDADNAGTASGKHCIDGLVAARVIPDDESPRYVTGVRYIIGPIFPRGRIVLHVTEEPAGAAAGAA